MSLRLSKFIQTPDTHTDPQSRWTRIRRTIVVSGCQSEIRLDYGKHIQTRHPARRIARRDCFGVAEGETARPETKEARPESGQTLYSVE